MGYKYEIYRPTETYTTVAQKAAIIAERIAPKAPYLKKQDEVSTVPETNINRFSFGLAFKSIFKRPKSLEKSTKAQERIFKGLVEEQLHSNVSLGDKKKPRKFYCSSFGAQVFQKVVAQEALSKYFEENLAFKEEFEQFISTLNKDNIDTKAISQWAKKAAKEHGIALVKKIKIFNVDYKYMSPQDFVLHVENHQIATHIADLVPPK